MIDESDSRWNVILIPFQVMTPEQSLAPEDQDKLERIPPFPKKRQVQIVCNPRDPLKSHQQYYSKSLAYYGRYTP